MRASRVTVAAIIVLLVTGSLAVVVGFGTHDENRDPTTVSVPPHPDDSQLQREDEVVVENASERLAANLSLIVHRVDALVGGDGIRSRYVLEVGGSRSLGERPRFASEKFYLMTAASQRLMGFPESRSKRDSGPFALASSPPGSRNATISLPLPRQVTADSGVSYAFILAHEVGNVVNVSRIPDRDLPETPLTDAALAYTALNEGSATRVGQRYVQKYGGEFDPEEMAPDPDDPWRTRVTAQLYYEGYQYTAARQLNGSQRAAVSSTAEILHPGANRTAWQLPETTFDRRLEGVSEPTTTNRAGELMVDALLVARGTPPSRAERVAAGWRNGRIDQYDTEERTVAVWTTEWANETAAASFTETYATRVPATRVEGFDEEFNAGDCGSNTRLVAQTGDRVQVVSCR